MNRREFAAAALVAGAFGLPALARAQRLPHAGSDYKVPPQRVPTEAPPGKIEVVEFFWYSCPHCNAFEPQLEAWARNLPPDVVLRRVPVAFRDDFVPQQRLFYTLQAMGKVDELQAKVFHAIHMERQPLHRRPQIFDWARRQGLDMERFESLYDSPAIDRQARQATQLQGLYQVEGVPAMGVAGRYYTDGSLAGSLAGALQVTDYLITEARKNA